MRRAAALLLLLPLAACQRATAPVDAAQAAPAAHKAAAPGPVQLAAALDAHLERIQARLGEAVEAAVRNDPSNPVRRAGLRLRIRTAEQCLQAAQRPNHLFGLVQVWYGCAVLAAHLAQEPSPLGAQRGPLHVLATELCQESETLAGRFLPGAQVDRLRAEIAGAAGSGELFAAASPERAQAIERFLNAARLEGVLGMALAPFEALGAVGKGADAMAALVLSADRATALAARYPQLVAWHLELAVLEIQEQDALRAARADLRSLAETGRGLGETARELPRRLREEAQALLAAGPGLAGEARGVLERAEAAARAVAGAVEALDRYRAHLVEAPARPGREPEPFRIAEWEAALRALEGAAAAFRAAVSELDRAGPGLARQAASAAAVAGAEGERLLRLARDEAEQLRCQARGDAEAVVDRAALRVAQVAAMAAALVGGLLLLARFIRRG